MVLYPEGLISGIKKKKKTFEKRQTKTTLKILMKNLLKDIHFN